VAYVRTKLIQLVVVLLVVSFLTFSFLKLLEWRTGVGPEIAILGTGVGNEEAVEEVRGDLNLDDPYFEQYGRWVANAAQGDLGESYANNSSVTELIGNAFPKTALLMIYAMVLSLMISIPLGIISAYRADGIFDKVAGTTAFALLSVPTFIFGVLLVYFFALELRWLPATGYTSFGDDPVEHVRRMVLPVIALAVGQIAIYTRLLRTDMISTLQEDYISVARAKGMPNRRILLQHAFRPSSFSLLTVAAINIGTLIGGSVVIEQIFAINGMGTLIVTSIFKRDYLVIQGCVLLIAVVFVTANFVVDILYAYLDPRIRHARSVS
jgi:peptide/nickel transport system permease protein